MIVGIILTEGDSNYFIYPFNEEKKLCLQIIYYRYANPDYSITEMPLSVDDCKLIKEAITLLSIIISGAKV